MEPSLKGDEKRLHNLGYEQELKRSFSTLEIFGLSFSIMSLVPSIASVLYQAMAAGGVGMTWGWFVPCIFIMSVGISLSELASAMPVSASLYWWSFKMAPQRFKKIIAFETGWILMLGLFSATGSINYGFTTQLLSCPALASSGYVPNKYHTFAVYTVSTIIQALVGTMPSQWMSKLQTFTILLNAVAIVLVVVALPVGLLHKGGKLNTAGFVFGNTYNSTDWQYGWSFLLSWLAAIWTISSHDSCIYMCEEAHNAPVAVPFGIIVSIGLSWILGFLVMAVLGAVTQDFAEVINSDTGNSFAELIRLCLNNHWAVGMMAFFAFIQFFMGLSCLVSTSRQTYAFARDKGMPFSWWVRKLNGYGIPVNAIIVQAAVIIIIGLLILINDVAADAIFSLSVSSVQFAWLVPILIRAIWFRKDEFTPGPFYLGHFWSRVNCWVASIYSIFIIFVLSMMPTVKNVDASTMNYTCVISVAVWAGSLLYYYFDAHKWFDGPQVTVSQITDASDSDGSHGVECVTPAPDSKEEENEYRALSPS